MTTEFNELDSVVYEDPIWMQVERKTLEIFDTPEKLAVVGFPEKWEKDIARLIYVAGDMCISEETRRELGL